MSVLWTDYDKAANLNLLLNVTLTLAVIALVWVISCYFLLK